MAYVKVTASSSCRVWSPLPCHEPPSIIQRGHSHRRVAATAAALRLLQTLQLDDACKVVLVCGLALAIVGQVIEGQACQAAARLQWLMSCTAAVAFQIGARARDIL